MAEGKRLRRLNETDKDYNISIKRLKEKCKKSGFKKDLIKENIEVIKQFSNPWSKSEETGVKEKGKSGSFTPWATGIKPMIEINRKVSKLVPTAKVVYQRPQTLGAMLTRYKAIAHGLVSEKKGATKKCGSCGLCGNFGKLKNMVKEVSEIKTKDGRKIKLKQTLTCKDFGIYAAQCKFCMDFYVGQTINTFQKRWTTHRKSWNDMMKERTKKGTERNNNSENDKNALFLHWKTQHPEREKGKLFEELTECFHLYFLERSRKENLDAAEGWWIGKLKAGINISKTFIPKFQIL